jgi:hypothetical protein
LLLVLYTWEDLRRDGMATLVAICQSGRKSITPGKAANNRSPKFRAAFQTRIEE